jgi:hypothetical protein
LRGYEFVGKLAVEMLWYDGQRIGQPARGQHAGHR